MTTLTTIEAAAVMGITPCHVTKLWRAGAIQGRKQGRRLLIDEASARAWQRKAAPRNGELNPEQVCKLYQNSGNIAVVALTLPADWRRVRAVLKVAGVEIQHGGRHKPNGDGRRAAFRKALVGALGRRGRCNRACPEWMRCFEREECPL